MDISYVHIASILMLLSAFFTFKVSKNHKNRTSFLIASSGFMVMFLYYAVPIIGGLSIQAIPLNYGLISPEEYVNLMLTISSAILIVGNLLLTYSMYTFYKTRENV